MKIIKIVLTAIAVVLVGSYLYFAGRGMVDEGYRDRGQIVRIIENRFPSSKVSVDIRESANAEEGDVYKGVAVRRKDGMTTTTPFTATVRNGEISIAWR